MPTNQNVDVRQIDAAIQIAEERFIRPAMCDSFYYDFRNKKNKKVTALNKEFLEEESGIQGLEIGTILNAIEFVGNQGYVELWDTILRKTISECVLYIATPTNASQFTSSGEMEENPSSLMSGNGAVSVNIDKLRWKTKLLLEDRVSPMLASLNDYLFQYRSLFPLYNCKQFNVNDKGDIINQRKTPIIFGIYDDGNNSGECKPCDKKYYYGDY